MSNEGSVTALLLQLHSDDPEVRDRAAGELIRRYAPELLALIAGRMQPRLRQRVDPEDVLQDVLLSFYNRLRRGAFDLADRDQFLSLVVTVALNKVRSAARRERRQRRDQRREQPLDAPEGSGPSVEPPAPDPAAEMVAEIAEEVERLLADLPPECREVLLLRLDGHTTEEIARAVHRTPRTVERRMELVRTLWNHQTPDPD